MSCSQESIIRPFSHLFDIVDSKRVFISCSRLIERSAEQLLIGSDSRLLYSTSRFG